MNGLPVLTPPRSKPPRRQMMSALSPPTPPARARTTRSLSYNFKKKISNRLYDK